MITITSLPVSLCLFQSFRRDLNEVTAVYNFRILSCVPLCNHDAPVTLRLKFRVTSLNINCRRGSDSQISQRPTTVNIFSPPTTVNI